MDKLLRSVRKSLPSRLAFAYFLQSWVRHTEPRAAAARGPGPERRDELGRQAPTSRDKPTTAALGTCGTTRTGRPAATSLDWDEFEAGEPS